MQIRFLFLIIPLFVFSSCQEKKPAITKEVSTVVTQPDEVFDDKYHEVRLSDGVPLMLRMYVRYELDNPRKFRHRFPSMDTFNQMILYPQVLEISKKVANTFESVDSVFHGQRQEFIDELKNSIAADIDEAGISIKQITVADIGFPPTFTNAMEKVALQKQEMNRINRENEIQIAEAEALRKKAEADGKVAIAQAEAEGRLQKIQAKTEQERRKIELARAETAAAVDRKKAQAEAERKRLLAQASAQEKRELQAVDLEKKRELDKIALENKQKADELALDRETKMALIYKDNPVYATMIVNKELAANVEIAVLPATGDASVFSGLLQNQMPSLKKD